MMIAVTENHGFYAIDTWAQMAPWALLPPSAIHVAASQHWKDPFTRLLLLWFGTTLLFLSIATTKREVYLLPAYPAAAILIGRHLYSLIADPSSRACQIDRWFLGVIITVASLPLVMTTWFPQLLDHLHLTPRSHAVIGTLIIREFQLSSKSFAVIHHVLTKPIPE
jgi:4-amino-4-deoxy-L-arabinose transferase-like glycosyltransferase